ncbi:hypothetical protein CGRA01v4_05400 [Colletotrichum graminicola]|nr:hypothetical protein CGRA01v4_05400 [Colletotrichum graminicola]
MVPWGPRASLVGGRILQISNVVCPVSVNLCRNSQSQYLSKPSRGLNPRE